MEVYVLYQGTKLPSFYITVTASIDPALTTLACTPTSLVASSTPVTCTITTPAGTGEVNAAVYFDAIVYNTVDVELTVTPDPAPIGDPARAYKGPSSKYIPTSVGAFDFPTITPAVTQTALGTFQFTFVPWRPGAYAAFVRYMNIAIAFPNPAITDVLVPEISATTSLVDCPTVAAPQRDLPCVLHLHGVDGQDAAVAAAGVNNQSNPQGLFVNATINSTILVNVSVLWSGEGRLSLLTFPPGTGTLRFNAYWKGLRIPTNPVAGVDVRSNYATTCARIPILLQGFTLMHQHMLGRESARLYGLQATLAQYYQGLGFCDRPVV
jgi:hypothetical protein